MQLFQYLEHPVDNGRSVSGGYVSLSGHVSGTGLVLHLRSKSLDFREHFDKPEPFHRQISGHIPI